MCLDDAHFSRRETLVLGMAAVLGSALPRLPAGPSAPGALTIRRREEWGADLPPTGPLLPEPDVRFLLVHHTAGRTDYNEDQVVGAIREVFHYHTGPDKGWHDVCYNFFVDRFGGIWEGRAGSADGPVTADATGGSQGFAQLICLLGNFQENAPSREMVASLEMILAHLAARYSINVTPGSATTFISRGSNKWPAGAPVTARTISGHREMSNTLCPGDNVFPLLDRQVPERAAALLAMTLQGTSTSEAQTIVTEFDPPLATALATPLTAADGPTTPPSAEVPPPTAALPPPLSIDSSTPQAVDDRPVETIAGAVAVGGAVVAIAAVIAARGRAK